MLHEKHHSRRTAPKVSKGRRLASGDKEKAERVNRNERPTAATIEAADATRRREISVFGKEIVYARIVSLVICAISSGRHQVLQQNPPQKTAGESGIRRRPMLPGRVQPSTFGTERLNFCVRDGNRWDPLVIATGNGELFTCGEKKERNCFLFPSLLAAP